MPLQLPEARRQTKRPAFMRNTKLPHETGTIRKHPTVGDPPKNAKLTPALHVAPAPPNSRRSSQSPHSRDPGARPGKVPTLQQRHPRGGQAPTAKLIANRSDSRRSRATPANRHKPCTCAVGRRRTAPDSRGRVRTPQVGFSHQGPGPHRGHRTVDGTGQPRSRSAIVPAQKPWATKTAGRWTGRWSLKQKRSKVLRRQAACQPASTGGAMALPGHDTAAAGPAGNARQVVRW